MNLDSSNFTHEIRIVTFHLRICLLYLGAFLKLFFWFNQPIYVCAFKENVFPMVPNGKGLSEMITAEDL
jgi:hypothetical protein